MSDSHRNRINTLFYPTTLKGCQGVIFTHGVQMGIQASSGKSLSVLYLRNCKMYEVDTWLGLWLWGIGVQRHGVSLI